MPRIKKNEMLLINALEDFMTYCVNKNLSKKTLKSYESSLRLFFKFLEEEYGIIELKQVQEKHIKNYMEWTKERGKYSFVTNPKTLTTNNPQARGDFGKTIGIYTINNYIRNIKVFFSYCLEEEYITSNVARKIKEYKNTRLPKEDITDNDFRKLINAIDTTTFAGHRDYVILHLLLDTGMRIGECLSLKVKDINFNRKTIFISALINKGRRDRYVFFSAPMLRILDLWIDYKDRYLDTEYLFISNRNNKLNIQVLEKNLKKYLRRAGIEKNITCHTFRNNFGKRFLSSGGSVYILSQILGHSSVEVTQQAYADLLTEDIRKNYLLHSPIESIKGGK